MTQEGDSIRARSKMLSLPHATQDDARLISQVDIWSTSSKIFDTFGTDMRSPLDIKVLPQLRRLSIAIDTYRADWVEAFTHNDYVGDYPAKGVKLHFHFAKLYLCSHAFRGISSTTHSGVSIDPEVVEVMSTALSSALSIVRTVNSDEEIQSHLNGLPLYFDTMIAFAAVFLLKVIRSFTGILRLDVDDILRLVEELAHVLKKSTSYMHQRHLLVDIANSLQKAVDKVRQSIEGPAVRMANDPDTVPRILDTGEMPWFDSPTEGHFFQNFDFLSTTNAMSGFETQNGYYDIQL